MGSQANHEENHLTLLQFRGSFVALKRGLHKKIISLISNELPMVIFRDCQQESDILSYCAQESKAGWSILLRSPDTTAWLRQLE